MARLIAQIGVLVIAIGLVGGLSEASASAATPVATVGTSCVTVLAKAATGSHASKVLSRSCGSTSSAAARTNAVTACGCETLLVIFYENLNYGGYSDYIYGHDGTCDSSGYGISNLDATNYNVNGISSYRLQGACNVSEKFTGHNFSGTSSNLIWGANQSYVGATWNDKMKSFWTLKG